MKNKKRKTVGYGYVGEWASGELGWFLPRHIHFRDTPRHPSTPFATFSSALGCRGVFCKITIEEVPGRKGRRTIK